MTRTLSWITAILVLLVSAFSFVLSYSALRIVALSAINQELAWMWPLVVDGAMIVFALVVIHFSLTGKSTIWPGLLVAVFTFTTIGFNAYHASQTLLSMSVAIIPPIALFLSFEVFMWMVKSGIQRREVSQSLDNLATERDKLIDEVDKLKARQKRYQDKLTKLETKPTQPIVILGLEPTELSHAPDKRQPLVRQLIDKGVSDERIIETFGISQKTLDRDKTALSANGRE